MHRVYPIVGRTERGGPVPGHHSGPPQCVRVTATRSATSTAHAPAALRASYSMCGHHAVAGLDLEIQAHAGQAILVLHGDLDMATEAQLRDEAVAQLAGPRIAGDTAYESIRITAARSACGLVSDMSIPAPRDESWHSCIDTVTAKRLPQRSARLRMGPSPRRAQRGG